MVAPGKIVLEGKSLDLKTLETVLTKARKQYPDQGCDPRRSNLELSRCSGRARGLRSRGHRATSACPFVGEGRVLVNKTLKLEESVRRETKYTERRMAFMEKLFHTLIHLSPDSVNDLAGSLDLGSMSSWD